MKIWREQPPLSRFSHSREPENSQSYPVVFSHQIHRYTRKDKIFSYFADILQPDNAAEQAVRLTGAPKTLGTYIESDFYAELFPRITYMIRPPLLRELDEIAEVRGRSQTFLDVTHVPHPKEYEKTFSAYADREYAGVALNIEHYSRAYGVLAHKFGLAVALTDIVHERHTDKAQTSNADVLIVLEKTETS